MLAFMHKVHRIAMDIMSCLAIGLGLPEDYYFQVQLFLLSSDVAFDCFCITCCPYLLPDAPELQELIFNDPCIRWCLSMHGSIESCCCMHRHAD